MRRSLTAAEQEAAFQQHLEDTEAYNAAIIAAGDEPWHGGDIGRRRALFMRRYTQPTPPVMTTNREAMPA